MHADPKIALVTRLSPEGEAEWLGLLRAALPQETVLSLREMSGEDRAAADIAIVVDPAPEDLGRLPNLVWVQSLWAGVERLVADLPDFPAPIVRLVDPQLARNMSEAVLAWTYYLFRDMPAYARQQARREWIQQPYRRAEDVTVGLLGLGELGTAAALRLREQGFNVIGWSRSPKAIAGIDCHAGEAGLDAVLSRSQILICLLPLTPATRGLLGRRAFAAMPKGRVINFARGPIVDSAALIAALDAGQIGHAVLDVFDVEPLPVDSPLWSHPGVTVLPHISGPTDPRTGTAIAAANIRRFRTEGTLPQSVDMRRGY